MVGILLLGITACGSSFGQNDQEKDSATNTNEETRSDGVKLLPVIVTNVVDGDTIDVKIHNKEERVRLLLIDTPETKHPSKPVQAFGPEAFEYTKRALLGKKVGLEKDVSERDRYGRLLAYIWLDGKMHNAELIEKGLARVATFPPDIKYVNYFREKQLEAQKQGVGIWSIENYVQENGFKSTDLQKQNQKAIKEQDNDITNNKSCVGKIKGNKNSKIYHMPSGVYYDKVAEHNIVWFCSEDEAHDEGYQKSET